jgi:hypothetical protein
MDGQVVLDLAMISIGHVLESAIGHWQMVLDSGKVVLHLASWEDCQQ